MDQKKRLELTLRRWWRSGGRGSRSQAGSSIGPNRLGCRGSGAVLAGTLPLDEPFDPCRFAQHVAIGGITGGTHCRRKGVFRPSGGRLRLVQLLLHLLAVPNDDQNKVSPSPLCRIKQKLWRPTYIWRRIAPDLPQGDPHWRNSTPGGMIRAVGRTGAASVAPLCSERSARLSSPWQCSAGRLRRGCPSRCCYSSSWAIGLEKQFENFHTEKAGQPKVTATQRRKTKKGGGDLGRPSARATRKPVVKTGPDGGDLPGRCRRGSIGRQWLSASLLWNTWPEDEEKRKGLE